MMSIPGTGELVSEDEILKQLGMTIDQASRRSDVAELRYAILHGAALQKHELSAKHSALLHYFLGNALSEVARIETTDSQANWNWDQPLRELALYEYRFAASEMKSTRLSALRRAQIFTSIANCLDTTGRFVEAIAYWNRSLNEVSDFPMALGNIAISLNSYARVVQRPHHLDAMLLKAESLLRHALSHRAHISSHASNSFAELLGRIEQDRVCAPPPIESYLGPLMVASRHADIREWTLDNNLFLNPLNDLGPYEAAAHDCTFVPLRDTDRVTIGGLGDRFDAMRNEFMVARESVYQGLMCTSSSPSSSGVFGFSGGLGRKQDTRIEHAKVGYRAAYSLLDKIAVFINDYLGLDLVPQAISFRSIWYTRNSKKGTRGASRATQSRSLRDEFRVRQNWPLRGLKSLAVDLEPKGPFANVLDYDLGGITNLRNRLEHTGVVVVGSDSVLPGDQCDVIAVAEFEKMTIYLLKTVRAALIYLASAVTSERGPAMGMR